MASPLDQVLGLLRAQHEARRRSALDLAGRIKELADSYAAAVDHEAAGDIASKLGLTAEPQEGPSVAETAAALRAAVGELVAPPDPVTRPKPKPVMPAPPAMQEVREDRKDIEARSLATFSNKLVVPREIEKKVAKANPTSNVEEEACEVEHLPKLQAASRRKPIVIVGGLVEKKKLDWIRKHIGIEAQWIETENGVKGVQKLEGRILDGNVVAVVMLEALIKHKHFDPVVAATRQTGTPLAYADTGGTGALKKALREIEAML